MTSFCTVSAVAADNEKSSNNRYIQNCLVVPKFTVSMSVRNDLDRERYIYTIYSITGLIFYQDNIQILRDLSLLQIQMRDLEGFRVSLFFHFWFLMMC